VPSSDLDRVKNLIQERRGRGLIVQAEKKTAP
jgi:hypothetical protein